MQIFPDNVGGLSSRVHLERLVKYRIAMILILKFTSCIVAFFFLHSNVGTHRPCKVVILSVLEFADLMLHFSHSDEVLILNMESSKFQQVD